MKNSRLVSVSVGVAIHIVQWQFYLQPLRVLLYPLSIQQSQGQKDLTEVGAKDRQKARVFRASPFLFGHQECSSSIGGTIERPF
ncbi:hypothetical protein MtrunA17_Chr4g0006761 [Medicago truncatula]|uniref:Transmembrane protein n=1 Tax=Medicago truncatula TaxID=3880 RepID=A0A396HZR5_MEDTR|nr:hypothetical protein MtrunA17_Chr4g0006761 [Medicago truncatula]